MSIRRLIGFGLVLLTVGLVFFIGYQTAYHPDGIFAEFADHWVRTVLFLILAVGTLLFLLWIIFDSAEGRHKLTRLIALAVGILLGVAFLWVVQDVSWLSAIALVGLVLWLSVLWVLIVPDDPRRPFSFSTTA